MQAALRAALAEFTKGLSTAAVVWASSSTPSCICQCPEWPSFPTCPPCVCEAGRRRDTLEEVSLSVGLAVLAAVWLVSVVAAFKAGQSWRGSVGVRSPEASPLSPVEEEFAQQAKAQTARALARVHYGGAR